MSVHRATVDWGCEGDFAARRYSRAHRLSFDGGLSVPGTAAPVNVDPRNSMPGALDPEQAFTAALSACHMLWFLDFAARAGFLADAYHDDAEGVLGEGPAGRRMMTRVILRPRVEFAGARLPTSAELSELHEKAHAACFIANSVRTDVAIEPAPWPPAASAGASPAPTGP